MQYKNYIPIPIKAFASGTGVSKKTKKLIKPRKPRKK
jgi:hypothetical protein